MGLRFGPALALTPPSGARCHIAALYRTDGELLAVMGYPFSTLRTGANRRRGGQAIWRRRTQKGSG